MWWKTILRPRPSARPAAPLFDEEFLRRLERLALVATKTLRGDLTGGHRSQRRLPAPTVADHRPYTHGDDLRYVDWHAYARHSSLQIKMGEAEQDVPVTIVLDQSASMDYGPAERTKSAAARQLAAAIAYCAMAQGDRVTVQPLGGGPTFQGKNRQQGAALLRYLTALPMTDRGDLVAQLGALPRSTAGGLVVVISDLWHASDLADALRLLHAPRWQVVILHLLAQSELTPDLDGDVELVDSETGATWALHVDATIRQRYERRLEAWCGAVEAMCARHGANYALLSTDKSLERAMLPYLRARQVLQ